MSFPPDPESPAGSLTPHDAAASPPADANVPFKAVLLYEDESTARRAVVASVKLAAGLHPEAKVSHSVWRFDLCDDDHWRSLALADAAEADAVVVSSISPALPPGVRTLLDTHLSRQPRHQVLLLLSGTDEEWTITIRHASGFSAENDAWDKSFSCGYRPHGLRRIA